EDPGAAHSPMPLRGQGPPCDRTRRRPETPSTRESWHPGDPAGSVITRGVLGVDDERDDDGTWIAQRGQRRPGETKDARIRGRVRSMTRSGGERWTTGSSR